MAMTSSGGDNGNIGQIVEQMLSFVPETVAHIIRLGAIPHRLSPEIIQLLADDSALATSTGVWLNRLSLAQADEEGDFRYHAQFRRALRQQLFLSDPTQFHNVNRRLYDYYVDASTHHSAIDVFGNEHEAFYHLLQFDADRGIRQFRRRFEQLIAVGQRGHAEQFVAYAEELEEQLLVGFRGWIEFWRARLQLTAAHPDPEQTVALFESLVDDEDAILSAISIWGIGLVNLTEKQWTAAISIFQDALAKLDAINDQIYSSYICLSLGVTYQDFAETSGGLEEGTEQQTEQKQSLWSRIEHLPFDAYASLAKRFEWLPTWYLSPYYQDWIIYYLLRQSLKWYQRAERLASKEGTTDSLLQAQQGIAHLEFELGRYSRSLKHYELLLNMPQVRASKYRTAKTQLGIGEVYQAIGDGEAAESTLWEATKILKQFRDNHAVGRGMRKLGDLYAQRGQIAAAVDAYEGSIHAFTQSSEVYERTNCAIALEALRSQVDEGGDIDVQIMGTVASVDERAYVARFPDRLLKIFRRLSLLIALPISFLSMILLATSLIGTFSSVEGGVRLWLIGEPFAHSIVRSVIMFALVVIVFLAVFWLYRLLYALIGAIIVAYSGRNLLMIEREQPTHYLVNADRLEIHSANQQYDPKQWLIPWVDIVQISTITYGRWLHPIKLYSNTVITLEDRTIFDIPALTNQYPDLLRNIYTNLKPEQIQAKSWFSIFRSWFSVVTIGVSLIIAIGRVFTRQLFDMPGYRLIRAVAEDRQHVPLWVTSVVFFFSISLLFLFQAVLLWRLFFFQQIGRRKANYRSRTIPTWVIFVLAVISTILVILWGVFLQMLVAGAS